MRCRRVPNPLTLAIAVLGVALAATRTTSVSPAQAFGGLAVGLLLMFPGFLIGATGGGDVKLFAALGTVLGPSRTGWAFLYTALVGAALALAIAWRRKRLATTIERAMAWLNFRSPVAQWSRLSHFADTLCVINAKYMNGMMISCRHSATTEGPATQGRHAIMTME